MDVVSGDVVIDPAVPEATVNVVLSASSFASGHPKRDGDTRSAKFLHADEYPELTFLAGTLTRNGDRWALEGELTVRGTTAPATLSIESIETDRGGFRGRATTRIDRYAFGVTAAKGMAARYLDVELSVGAEAV